MPTPDSQHPIIQQLQEFQELPSPPAVAMKIVEVSRDPDKGLKELAEVLQLDAAIAAKVLRISNSAGYARAREVATVPDAINLLGAKTVSIIALGFALQKAVPPTNHPTLTDTVLWKHSVATAVACRRISRFMGTGADDVAFMCGLMSRIGQLLFLAIHPDEYAPAIKASTTLLPTAQDERNALGITHHTIGRMLLDNWNIPSTICDVVEYWGEPDLADGLSADSLKLIAAARVADTVRKLIFEEEKADALLALHDQAASLCSISDGEIDRLFVSCQDELEETLAVFTDASEKISCEEILIAASRELVQASLALATELTASRQDCERLRESNDELEQRSSKDPLTNLPNRASLDARLSALDDDSVRGRRSAKDYSLMMVDIDHFKRLNDTYGHLVGDQVLQAVAASLADCARTTDFVARYGGEEFTVILPNCNFATAEAVAERFRIGIKERGVELDSGTVFVTASIGIASTDTFPQGTSQREILQGADTALYHAKQQGRDRVVQYEPAQVAG